MSHGEHGVVLWQGDRLWFSSMERSGDGWDVALLNGGTLHVMENDIIQRPEKNEKKAQSVAAAVPEIKKDGPTKPPVSWLKDCEICNAGLCKEMTYLTDSADRGGLGLPVREAAKRLEEQGKKQIGDTVWTAEQIRARYLYYAGKTDAGRKPTTPKKVTPSTAATTSAPPPAPATQEIIDSKSTSAKVTPLKLVSKEEDSDPLYQLKRWWKKAGERERANFVIWMKSSEAGKSQRKQNA